MRRSIAILLAVLTFAAVVPAQAADAEWLEGLDGYVEQVLAEWEVPGVAVAVVYQGRVVHAKGYGVRERGQTAPVDAETLFAIGSSSKAFTAAAIAMLVADGSIDLDDLVIDHLPGFRLHDAYATREMTVRDLLCHRSGLSRGDLLWYGTPFSRAEVVERIRYLEPSWSFRSRFGYQNIMFLAAGLVIEAASGIRWDAFVDERIFTPLGMDASNTSTTALAGLPNVATPHVRFGGSVEPVPWRNIDNVAPAGSINSNVLEMARWVRLQLARGTHDDTELIPANLVDETHTPQMVLRNEGRWNLFFPASELTSYGLGWFVNDYSGKKVVEHGGAIDGMRATVSLMPAEELGMVILSNLGGTAVPESIRYRVYDLFLRTDLLDWSSELLGRIRKNERDAAEQNERRAAMRTPDTKPSLALADYTGSYDHAMYTGAVVTLEAGRLQLAFGTAFGGPMEHWQHDTFRIAWDDRMMGQTFVNFTLDADGRVAGLEIEGIAEFDSKELRTGESTP